MSQHQVEQVVNCKAVDVAPGTQEPPAVETRRGRPEKRAKVRELVRPRQSGLTLPTGSLAHRLGQRPDPASVHQDCEPLNLPLQSLARLEHRELDLVAVTIQHRAIAFAVANAQQNGLRARKPSRTIQIRLLGASFGDNPEVVIGPPVPTRRVGRRAQCEKAQHTGISGKPVVQLARELLVRSKIHNIFNLSSTIALRQHLARTRARTIAAVNVVSLPSYG